jgi:hypothetical protein
MYFFLLWNATFLIIFWRVRASRSYSGYSTLR